MIANVVLWQNGMVMVFDERGQQMPEYQGPWKEHRERILADAPASAQIDEALWR